MFRRLTIVCVAVSIALGGCSSSGGGAEKTRTTIAQTPVGVLLPQIRLGYPSGALIAEVAITPEELSRGLGYRDSLFTKGGMLFDLGSSRVPEFWMKGMRFPLDMVWIGEDKKIVDVTANVAIQPDAPDDQLKRYSPNAPVRYVLEVNAGAAASLGLTAGAQLDFTIPATLVATPAPAVATPVAGLPPTAVIATP